MSIRHIGTGCRRSFGASVFGLDGNLFFSMTAEQLLAEDPSWVDFGKHVIPVLLPAVKYKHMPSMDIGKTLDHSAF